MSKSQNRTHLLISALLLLVITAAACSSEAEPEKVSVADTGDFDTCEGFISAEHIEDEADTSGLVDRVRVLDVASIPGFAESGATANCLIEVFRTLDGSNDTAPGDSVTLSLVRFETNELAKSLYNSTLAAAILTAEQVGDLAEIHQDVVGTDSYLMDVKAGGIGAIVVYVFDSTFISMSSTADNENNALLDGQDLINAAQGVQSRLP
jgi:hypothetical protein